MGHNYIGHNCMAWSPVLHLEVMAYIVLAYVVMAYVVMAFPVMACIVLAWVSQSSLTLSSPLLFTRPLGSSFLRKYVRRARFFIFNTSEHADCGRRSEGSQRRVSPRPF